MTNTEIKNRIPLSQRDERLFQRHLKLHNYSKNTDSNSDEVTAFFIPRVNMFLGHPLIHGGVYPDGVIRLFKKGRAYLPAKSVHEQMEVDGQVEWLYNPLEHWDSPTLSRYISRLNRYTELQSHTIGNNKSDDHASTFFKYLVLSPTMTFFDRFLIHRGYKDGLYGFVWAVFSAWHFPISYFKFTTHKNA